MAIQIHQIDLNLKRRLDPLRCTLDDFRSSDEPMRSCLRTAWIAARTDLPILILGESGTGKTLLARAIHNSSSRAKKPFCSFNAAALSESLLDSQLFGHEPGAFTGATRRVRGKFEQAHGGTLFLDEIADMSDTAQAKILRAVEYGEFERLGSEDLRVTDVRVISATHLEQEEFLESGRFRRDLFFRLSGITIELPCLRKRPYDLPLLIAAEIEWASREQGKKITGLSKAALQKLVSYSWPGNLRELNRVIQAAVALTRKNILGSGCILLNEPLRGASGQEQNASGEKFPPGQQADLRLSSMERQHIQEVLRQEGGNKLQSAKKLGISRSTLDRKLKRYKIDC